MIVYREKEFGVISAVSQVINSTKNYRKVQSIDDSKSLSDEDKALYERLKKRMKRSVEAINENQDSSNCATTVLQSGLGGIFAKPENIIMERGNLPRHSSTINLRNDSPSVAAHEYGHALDYAAPGGYEKFAHKYKRKMGKGGISGLFGTRKGTRGYAEEIESGIEDLRNEASASRNGLKILKKEGATPKQMRQARKELQDALDTYYTAARSRATEHMHDSGEVNTVKAWLGHGRKLKKEYEEQSKRILRAGRDGTERKLEAESRSGLEKLGRKAKYVGIQAKRHPGKTAAIVGVTGAAGYGAHKAYKHYKNKNKKKDDNIKGKEV